MHRGRTGPTRCVRAGVITKVAIQCTPRSRAVNTILLAVPNFSHVPHLHALARAHLAEILSAFEFLDAASLHLALTHLPGVHSPVQGLHAMYMLIETSGARPCLLCLYILLTQRQSLLWPLGWQVQRKVIAALKLPPLAVAIIVTAHLVRLLHVGDLIEHWPAACSRSMCA